MTRTEIGELTPVQLNTIVKEVAYQEGIDDYKRQYAVASLMAAIYNTIPRKNRRPLQAKDFLSSELPIRSGKGNISHIDKLAQDKGIILPSK